MNITSLSEQQVEELIAQVKGKQSREEPVIKKVKFPALSIKENGKIPGLKIQQLGDVKTTLLVELDQIQKTVREILAMDVGTVVALNKLAGERVDIKINGVPFATGEVVVINDSFSVRITEVLEEQAGE